MFWSLIISIKILHLAPKILRPFWKSKISYFKHKILNHDFDTILSIHIIKSQKPNNRNKGSARTLSSLRTTDNISTHNYRRWWHQNLHHLRTCSKCPFTPVRHACCCYCACSWWEQTISKVILGLLRNDTFTYFWKSCQPHFPVLLADNYASFKYFSPNVCGVFLDCESWLFAVWEEPGPLHQRAHGATLSSALHFHTSHVTAWFLRDIKFQWNLQEYVWRENVCESLLIFFPFFPVHTHQMTTSAVTNACELAGLSARCSETCVYLGFTTLDVSIE